MFSLKFNYDRIILLNFDIKSLFYYTYLKMTEARKNFCHCGVLAPETIKTQTPHIHKSFLYLICSHSPRPPPPPGSSRNSKSLILPSQKTHQTLHLVLISSPSSLQNPSKSQTLIHDFILWFSPSKNLISSPKKKSCETDLYNVPHTFDESHTPTKPTCCKEACSSHLMSLTHLQNLCVLKRHRISLPH